MTLQRYLDNQEAQFIPAAGMLAVEYSGHVDEEALERAFDKVCIHHPVLRARIRSVGGRLLLYVPADYRRGIEVLDGDEYTLRCVANESWDVSHAVAQLVLIRGASRGYVALRLSVSITDGGLIRAALAELWRFYTDLVNGTEVSVEPGVSLPASPIDLLQRRAGVRLTPSLVDPTSSPDAIEFSSPIERRVVLPDTDTTSLVNRAHQLKTSVHALLCGAVLVALRDCGRPTQPTPMVCWSPINLRSRVDPPVSATEVTSFGIRHRTELVVAKNADPVSVGREVKQQIDTAIARRELSQEPIQSPPAPVDTSLEQRLATVLVSNAGVTPRFSQPAGLTITDLLLPQDTMTPLYPICAVMTYDGQLSLKFVCPSARFTNEEVENIVNDINAQLHYIMTLQPS